MVDSRYHQLRAPAPQKRRNHWLAKSLILAAALVMIGYGAAIAMRGGSHPSAASNNAAQTASNSTATTTSKNTATSTSSAAKPATNHCAGNAAGTKDVIVSISKRHLWACDGSATAYDSAVVTGMENLPADLTPTGTYHIYAKQTNLYLKGSDSTGSWNDYVYYWMPFLHNQYGSYGFHDATWRDPSAFGNIDPYSNQASHGCVEMPLAAAKWLYGWASIGTAVTIVS